MVDDRGRLRRESLSSATSNNPWNLTLVKCVIISGAVSIILQLSLPHVLHLLAVIWSFSARPADLTSLRLVDRTSGQGRAYLVEPLSSSEPWLHGQEVAARRSSREDEQQINAAQQAEALAALSAAVQSRISGNDRKCKAIMEHALALAPNHPDVLVEYGIFKETIERDLVEAEGFYTKALAYNPHHSLALRRIKKTRPMVDALDADLHSELRRKRDKFEELASSSPIRRAMRESYFAHIYHSVAIEGNTLSLGQTRSILETGMAVPGKSILEHNEVLGMDSALRFINRTLIDRDEITLDDILEMHSRVLGHVAPQDAGRFRSTQVYVGRFTPASPSEVPSQMREFVDWLNDPVTAAMEPVERAAIAHYKLVLTHPFIDGNGRTARLLMNVCLMRAGFPPVILPVQERAEYYATLHTANLGDLRPFVRFVAKHTDRTLQAYIDLATTHDKLADFHQNDALSSEMPLHI